MSGGTSAATIAAFIGAGVAAAGTGFAVKSGMDQEGAQETALKKQTTAQQTATAAALSTERKSEVAQGAVNTQTPDIAGILSRAANGGKGLSATMLTGPGGAATPGSNLGGATLLGS